MLRLRYTSISEKYAQETKVLLLTFSISKRAIVVQNLRLMQAQISLLSKKYKSMSRNAILFMYGHLLFIVHIKIKPEIMQDGAKNACYAKYPTTIYGALT